MSRHTLVWSAMSIAISTWLAGCSSMAPEYQRPVAPVPKVWSQQQADVDSKSLSKTAVSQDWHAFFLDARLQAMITAALEYNRDMRIAVARVEEARAVYGVQRADQLPNLNIGAGRTNARVPAAVSATGAQYTSRRIDVNVGLLAFELDFWGRVASLTSAARASYLATEEAQRAFRLSLIADVVDGYLSLKEAQERAVVAQATVNAREEIMNLMSKRREVGLASDIDYLQTEGAYESARAELASLDRQKGLAENLLRVLVGVEKTDWPQGKDLSDQGIVSELSVDVSSEVLLRRPDIIAAEYKLIASNANIGAARAAFFPRIALVGSYGSASPQLSGLFDAGTAAWTFTPSLTLPLFSGGRDMANLDLAEARKIIAIAEYEKAIQQAFREVADGLEARHYLLEQVRALQAYEKSQRQRLVLAEARYGQGVASYLEVLDAQRDLYTAQQSLIQTRRVLLSTMARLYKALGGGLED